MSTGLRIDNLTLSIRGPDGPTPILRGVNLKVEAGMVQGLAGESGSGKTMTGLAITGLEPNNAECGGHIWFGDLEHGDGSDVSPYQYAIRTPDQASLVGLQHRQEETLKRGNRPPVSTGHVGHRDGSDVPPSQIALLTTNPASQVGPVDLLGLTGRRLNAIRGRRIGMVFQDPTASLHPQLTVGAQLTDHMRRHLKLSHREAKERACDGLNRVGITGGSTDLARYPHEFSGGQRQRIAIAIALACDPDVLIADEPTTALDVTVQAGILALIRDLVDSLGLAVLFITHDLGVMSAIADRVAVMRYGEVVEDGPREQVFLEPAHAYTRSLLASLPGAAGGLTTRDDLAKLGGFEAAEYGGAQ